MAAIDGENPQKLISILKKAMDMPVEEETEQEKAERISEYSFES